MMIDDNFDSYINLPDHMQKSLLISSEETDSDVFRMFFAFDMIHTYSENHLSHTSNGKPAAKMVVDIAETFTQYYDTLEIDLGKVVSDTESIIQKYYGLNDEKRILVRSVLHCWWSGRSFGDVDNSEKITETHINVDKVKERHMVKNAEKIAYIKQTKKRCAIL